MMRASLAPRRLLRVYVATGEAVSSAEMARSGLVLATMSAGPSVG